MDSAAVDLLGITNKELVSYFDQYLKRAATKLATSKKELLQGLKLWYDGYSFDGATFLYNPFSVLNFFRNNEFRNFWFATGTPTFLVNLLRDKLVRIETC